MNQHGWRARIGVIVPSVNAVLEPDFYDMAPQGVSVHASRLMRGKVLKPTLEDEFKMNLEIERAAAELATTEAGVILYGCTGGSLLEGVGYDKEIIDRIEKQTNIRATTTSTAMIRALKELDIKKLAVATPYPSWLNDKEREFLEGNGFEVVNIEGLGLTNSTEHHTCTPAETYRFVKQVDSRQADGIFISCTNFPVIEIIEPLEHDLGKPVVTSNQASMWEALRMVRVREPIRGYGILLESHL